MEIKNDTPLMTAIWIGEFPPGQPSISVVVKATFDFVDGRIPTLASEQLPVFFADQPYEPLHYPSAVLETDMVPFKERADIVLLGKAYAPGGEPAAQTEAFLRVGPLKKLIRVYGDRTWKFGPAGPLPDRPVPFTDMDLVYERAFGGVDQAGGAVFPANRLGRGFFSAAGPEAMEGSPLPNLEDPRGPVRDWQQRPKPEGFGFWPRNNAPRLGYLGTIDDDWSEKRAPELPVDFNPLFYNGAHPDLQVQGFLAGDEDVELRNVTPEAIARFRLPGLKPSVRVSRFDVLQSWLLGDVPDEPEAADPDHDLSAQPRKSEELALNLDTLVFLPEEKKFYAVWRGRCAIESVDTFVAEIATVDVGIASPPE